VSGKHLAGLRYSTHVSPGGHAFYFLQTRHGSVLDNWKSFSRRVDSRHWIQRRCRAVSPGRRAAIWPRRFPPAVKAAAFLLRPVIDLPARHRLLAGAARARAAAVWK